MSAQDRASSFIEKALQADDFARKSKEKAIESAWQKVAQDYRALATSASQARNDASSETITLTPR